MAAQPPVKPERDDGEANEGLRLGTLLSDLIDVMDIALWELDLNYRVVAFNRRARQIYGARARGDFCYHAAAGLDHVCPNCPARLVYEGKPSGRSEHERVDSAGNKIYIDHIATPIRNEAGELTGALVLIIDITDRRRMEEELREHRDNLEAMVADRTAALKRSELKYRELVESANSIIIKSDIDGRITFANDFALRFFGYTAGELLGRSAVGTILTPDEDDRLYSCGYGRSVLNAPEAYRSYVGENIRKDGGRVWISWTNRVIQGPDGEPEGILCIGNDITAQRRAEEENRLLEARLHQAARIEAVGTLAGGIAHDFNNMLSIILGNADLLEIQTAGDPDIGRGVSQIQSAAFRARDMVRRLLEFSRRTDRKPGVVSLGPIIEDAMTLLRSSIPTSVEIHKRLDETVSPVHADPGQIHQVMVNLCINAAQAMNSGCGTLTVSLDETPIDAPGHPSGLPPGRYVRLTVKDTGRGMDPGIRDRIFDPYFTTRPVGEGTGMGLSVVHGIIQGCGGAITVDSTPGKGTTFTLLFPAASPESAPATEEVREPVADWSSGGEHLLVVDDEPDVAGVARRMLETLGYRVTVQTHPLEALACFRADPDDFDLVITDLAMPEMTGDVLADRLIRIRDDIPILAITGLQDRLAPDQDPAPGITAVIGKPVDRRELADTVRRVLTAPAGGG